MKSAEFFCLALIYALCLTLTPIPQCRLRAADAQATVSFNAPVLLENTEHGGAEYLGKIIFIGDSRTYGLKQFEMLSGGKNTPQVWTPKNGTMSVWDMQYQRIVYPETSEEMTCAEAAAAAKPEIILISIGFNGFELVSREYFISEYAKLISSIRESSPDSILILQSIFPVCSGYPGVSNQQIRSINQTVFEIAQNAGAYYLNTQEALVDADGNLKEEYSTDGCHLTPLGLDVELDYICTHQAR